MQIQNKYKYTEKQNWIPSAILTETEVPGVTSVCTCLPQIPPQLVQTQMQRGDMNKCNTNKQKKHFSNIAIGTEPPSCFWDGLATNPEIHTSKSRIDIKLKSLILQSVKLWHHQNEKRGNWVICDSAGISLSLESQTVFPLTRRREKSDLKIDLIKFDF